MMNNSLDARALAAPGGAFQGLVDAVNQIVDGYVRNDQTNRQADLQDTMRKREFGRQDVADGQAETRYKLALAAAGLDPENPEAGMADVSAEAKRQRTAKAEQDNIAAAVAKINALRGGAINPDVTKPNEVGASIEGDKERKARLEGIDANAAWKRTQALLGLGVGKGGSALNKGTGWHQDKDSGTWFSRSADGTTEVFDPATKKTTVFDREGNPVGEKAEPPGAAPEAQGPGMVQRALQAVGLSSPDPVAQPMPAGAGPQVMPRHAPPVSTLAQQPPSAGIPAKPDWLAQSEDQEAPIRAAQIGTQLNSMPQQQRVAALVALAKSDPAAYAVLRNAHR